MGLYVGNINEIGRATLPSVRHSDAVFRQKSVTATLDKDANGPAAA